MTDDRIVVRDGQRLLVFDQNGRFLNKIGKRGRAPGEYGAIDHFYISKKQEIVIFRKSRGEKSDSGWTLYGDNGRRVEERKDVCKKGINDSAC